MTSADPWAGFVLDPRLPQHAGLRASDRDRVVVLDVLAEAYADGRLEASEHAERCARAERVKTYGEVLPLLRDLVLERPVPPGRQQLVGWSGGQVRAEAERLYASERRSALLAFLIPSMICWSIWMATMLGSGVSFPWPLIVSAVTLANLVRVVLDRDKRVAQHVQALERRRARALRRGPRFPGPPGPPGLPRWYR